MLEVSQQAMRSKAELTRTLAALTSRAEAVRERVPKTAGEAELLRQLTEIAEGEGVSLVDYRRGQIVDAADRSELRLTVKCEGAFDQLCRLLQKVQDMERIVVVERLRLTSTATGDRNPAELTLLVYFGLGGEEGTHG
jgi:Tfp pilus assembly protein PilO